MNKRMLSIFLYLASISLTKKTIHPQYHILLSTLTSNSFAQISLIISLLLIPITKYLAHTKLWKLNFQKIPNTYSMFNSLPSTKLQVSIKKCRSFASQSQRKRMKIQKAGRNREIISVFEEKLKDSDSTVYHWSCHTCRFAIQRGRDMVARKYAFLSVHSPVRFGGEMLRESL